MEEELSEVKHRISRLLDSGWKNVRVITDHGWLLLPGGLPKLDLPKHLTSLRWGRCAAPQIGAQHDFPETAWFWDGPTPIVLAPGIGSFVAGLEYSHGGLTLQEALLPMIEVAAGVAPKRQKPELVAARWKGLRLSVTVKNGSDLRIDVRRQANDPTTSVLAEHQQGQTVPGSGEFSVLLEDDAHLGAAALLVLIAPDGSVVFKHPLIIGET